MASDIILARLLRARLVVVARLLAPEHAMPVAEALVDAGVAALEITLDEPSALQTIARLHEHFGERLLVGAGTALDLSSAEAAIAAGADFVVSPVFIPAIVELCQAADVLAIPGAFTPNDMFQVLHAGTRAIKLFPASLMTPTYIHDVLEPLRLLQPVFMLTGGLDDSQIPAYLAAGVSIVGVGGAILSKQDLAAHAYEHIGMQARHILGVIQKGGQG